jgi:hypothetical protein
MSAASAGNKKAFIGGRETLPAQMQMAETFARVTELFALLFRGCAAHLLSRLKQAAVLPRVISIRA